MYKVFIADDEVWIVFALKKLIQKSGLPFQVVGEAGDGVTALEEMTESPVDVLFTDIRMPGYDGIELLKKMSEKKLETKVVFISGYAEFEYAQSALQLGAVDYLLKPVSQERLEEVLERLLILFDDDRYGPEDQEVLDNSMMRKLILEIQDHYMDNISLTSLSKTYGLSIGHLSTLIKKELGLSFSDYIAARRIQRAKELLADETLSIQAIAEKCGYNDYFYFTKVFKKVAGISPSKYRKQL